VFKKINLIKVNSFQTTPNILLLPLKHFIVDSNSRHFSKSILIDSKLWFRFFYMCLLNLPNCLNHLVDGLIFLTKPTQLVIQYNLNSMLSDSRVSVVTSIDSNTPSILSISTILYSATWLERELQEFSGITFLYLIDTRRLLLDYLEPKSFWQTHLGNDKNFNNNLYDINVTY
jgi:NADH:ubiquinone oxidoreductase subunit C